MESFPGELFYKPKVLKAQVSSGTYLFFDTETTGLPRNWSAPVSDLNNWPRLVQIAWIFYKDGEKNCKQKLYNSARRFFYSK